MFRRDCRFRRARLVDVQVTMVSDDAARAYMTVEVNAHEAQTGRLTVDAREANVNLAKRDGEWVVTNAETRDPPETVARPTPPDP